MKRLAILILSLFLALSCALLVVNDQSARAASQAYQATTIEEILTIQDNGSLLVTETITFQFTGDPFTYVFRELPTERTDGIEILSAQMDGQEMGRGTNQGQLEIEEGDPLKVTWHFAPRQNTSSTFVLSYRVDGVIQQMEQSDVLHWNAIPTDHEYDINTATVTVNYPEQVNLQQQPAITDGEGTVVDSTAGRVVFRANNLGEDDDLQIFLSFPSGSIISEAPLWQQDGARVQALNLTYLPMVLVASGLIALIGFWLLAGYQRRTRPAQELLRSTTLNQQTTPPDDLAPALAGTLIQTGPNQAGWNQALGTVFDLARRNVLHMEAVSSKPDAKEIKLLKREDVQDSRLRYEGILLNTLFLESEKRANFDEVSKRYQADPTAFSRAIESELRERGLVDTNRERTRRTLNNVGVILLILFMLLVVVSIGTAVVFGLWVTFIPTAVLLILAIAAWVLASIPVWSDQGLRTRLSWLQFARFLQKLATDRDYQGASLSQNFERYLPYATSFGYAQQWGEQIKKQDWETLPAWFSPMSGHGVYAHRNTSFATMMVVTSTHHSAHSGGSSYSAASSAGAAGGGGSGAG